MIFMSCAAHASLDRLRHRKSSVIGLRNLLHNAAFFCILIQLCMLYLSSSLAKITGPLWQNGTALYYVLLSEEYSNPALGPWLAQNYFMITLATYATIGVQLSFPFLVWTSKWRVPIICAIIFMHLGIGLQMGLARFSMVMISTALIFIPDQAYHRFGRLLLAPVRIGGEHFFGREPRSREKKVHAGFPAALMLAEHKVTERMKGGRE
jgi:hypothetical protein